MDTRRGVRASRLAVSGYRNFASFELDLAPRMTILVGSNAVGKTNLVEALQLLTAGASFRRPSSSELLREGSDRGRALLSLEGEGRLLQMGLELSGARRSFTRNGKRVTAAGVRGVLPSVLFCPDDLDMVKRSASVRRAALDSFGVQLNDTYARLLSAYERTVEQRNNLLRDAPDPDLLAVWDESLAATGAQLLMHRRALLARVRGRFIEVHRAIAPAETADVTYESTLGELGDARALSTAAPDSAGPSTDPAAHAAERDALTERFLQCLRRRRDDELRRGLTLVGPHRDEIAFRIDGRSARDFGSQGQQRSIVLAWKIAEVQVTRDILGYPPLLLLDDVMSELDAARREAITGFIEAEIQTVITTTNLGYFTSRILDAAKVVPVGTASSGGTLQTTPAAPDPPSGSSAPDREPCESTGRGGEWDA